MKQILYLFFFIFISISSISSQENKSRFGIEVGVIPWHFDTFSNQTPFSVSGFVGGYYEHFFTNSFALKATVGVQNTTYKWARDVNGREEERTWSSMLELKIEPRFYFWEKQQRWGNLFAGLPISMETGSFQNKENPYKTIFHTPTIRAIPVVGYQYYFARHWFVEVDAGLGWRCDISPQLDFNYFDYLLEARFGYSF